MKTKASMRVGKRATPSRAERRSGSDLEPRVTPAVLETISRKIAEAFRPERIILFGSHAYGTPSPDSDVDLLVIMNSRERPAERSARVVRVCRPRYVALDVMVRTPEEIANRLKGFDPFLEEILSRGKVLYEAPR
jgi:predicted nucleotidyltransferase